MATETKGEPEPLNVEKAALALGCGPALVYKLCEARKLGHTRLGFGRGKIVITEGDIQEYRARCRVLPADEIATGPEPRRRRRDVAIPDVLSKYKKKKGRKGARA